MNDANSADRARLEVPRQWCRRLRWKSYAHDAADLARVATTFDEGCVMYTCLSTTTALGEDGGVAAPERCGPDRRCYRRHPMLPVIENA